MKPEPKSKGAAVPKASAEAPLNPVAEALNDAVGESQIAELLIAGGHVGETEEAPEQEAEEKPTAEEAAEATPEETEPESAEQADEETDETTETETEETDEDEGITPEIQARIDKRIHKEVAKAKAAKEAAEAAEAAKTAAETRAQELETELETLRTERIAPMPHADNPLANITNERDLQQAAAHAEQVSEWAQNALDDLDTDPEGVEKKLREATAKNPLADYSPAAMQKWLKGVQRNADKTLRTHVPKRQEFLKFQAQADAATLAEFPWWKDAKSPEFAQAQQLLKENPEMKQKPHWRFMLSVGVLGLQRLNEIRAAAKAKEAPAAKAKPAPPRLPGTRKTVPTPPDPKNVVKTVAFQKFAETGSEKDLTGAIAAML